MPVNEEEEREAQLPEDLRARELSQEAAEYQGEECPMVPKRRPRDPTVAEREAHNVLHEGYRC